MWVIIGVSLIALTAIGMIWYMYFGQYYTDYRKARKEIFIFVESHKKRCTGNNRFVVTIESLQDSFREYNTSVITNVWLDLVNERVIEQDLNDNEWCVR